MHHGAAPAASCREQKGCSGRPGPSGGWAGHGYSGLSLHLPMRGLPGALWCTHSHAHAHHLAGCRLASHRPVTRCGLQLLKVNARNCVGVHACAASPFPEQPTTGCLCCTLCMQDSTTWRLYGSCVDWHVCAEPPQAPYPCAVPAAFCAYRRAPRGFSLAPTCAWTHPNPSSYPSCHSCTTMLPPSLCLSPWTCLRAAQTVSRTYRRTA